MRKSAGNRSSADEMSLSQFPAQHLVYQLQVFENHPQRHLGEREPAQLEDAHDDVGGSVILSTHLYKTDSRYNKSALGYTCACLQPRVL